MAFVDTGSETLTGVWLGIYSESSRQTAFTATLMELGSFLSGTTHETVDGLELFATVDGSRRGQAIRFNKTYDGSEGWSHTVAYEGRLSPDGAEIEGRWSVQGGFAGTFLMVRSGGKAASVAKRAHEVA